MALIEKKVQTQSWGNAAFEPHIRAFYENRPNIENLYKKIDDIYERDIFNHYGK
jgi:hypothetical protein